MQKTFMAIEQEAIAWLVFIAFASGSWGLSQPLNLFPDAAPR